MNGKLIHTYLGHKAPVLTLKMSKCCNFLLSSSKDFILNIWNLKNDLLVKSELIPKTEKTSLNLNLNLNSDNEFSESPTSI